jgi:hypothetical protein
MKTTSMCLATILSLAFAAFAAGCAPAEEDTTSEATGAMSTTSNLVAASFAGAKLTFKKEVELAKEWDPIEERSEGCGVVNIRQNQPELTIGVGDTFRVEVSVSDPESVSLALTQIAGPRVTPVPALRLNCRVKAASRAPRYEEVLSLLEKSGKFAVLSKE